jgi:hypothetical protein
MKSFTLLAALVLAGCATNPRDIEPISRDYRPLLINDCATLRDRETTTQTDLNRYREIQSNNRVSHAVDGISDLLGGWPWPSAWRNRKADARNEHAIARLSGELEAVQTARAVRCAEGSTTRS